MTSVVRRLRAVIAADDDLLEAALQALPESELRRIHCFSRGAMQTMRYGYQSDGSSEFDLPSGASASVPAAVPGAGSVDLLDLEGLLLVFSLLLRSLPLMIMSLLASPFSILLVVQMLGLL